MKVSEIMSRDVQIASPEDSLRAAASLMAQIDSGFLPVGENDRLVGTVTDRDLTIRGMAEGKGPAAKVRAVMSTDVRYCYEDQELNEVLATMGEAQVRRMPVLNRQKRLVGVLSLGDAARRHERAGVAEALEGISQPTGRHAQHG